MKDFTDEIVAQNASASRPCKKHQQGDARLILKTVYGYDSFRPLQEDIIDYVLSGRDALVLMPFR